MKKLATCLFALIALLLLSSAVYCRPMPREGVSAEEHGQRTLDKLQALLDEIVDGTGTPEPTWSQSEINHPH